MEESRTAGVGKARRCPRKEEWLDQATQLLVRTQSEQPQQHEFDIIYGNAGAIVALLVLHDILLERYKTLGQGWDNAALVAQKVAIFGINTYAASGKQWPCGISGGNSPGLLLGLAGIGYFYLRMYRPSTPSILLAQREGVVARP